MPFGCSSFKYEILEEIGVFGTNDNIEKKFCLVSWGDREPVLDIRPWRNDYTGVQPCKGITLTVEELRQLLTIGFGSPPFFRLEGKEITLRRRCAASL